jgi:microcystin-dependent protein
MPYSVTFTDSTNPAKPAITVADGSLNAQTSLTFPGKGYSGYAPILAGDMLHLLENFASATAPLNPVQGQLWYDTSTGNNILRVYDGAGNWPEAGSIKRAGKSTLAATGGVPDITNSNIGDLWVDSDNSQLYLFSGSSWLLVGPQFSAGQSTGPLVESIVDTQNVSHNVISLYASQTSDGTSYRVAIISKDAFTPKSAITGYAIINAGINLYANTINGDQATIWGTAQTANALIANGNTVAGANFLRSDVTSTTNQPFNIRNQGGLGLGGDLSFNISQGNNTFLFNSKNSTNAVDFVLNSVYLLHIDPTGKVGIGAGNTNPATTLSVSGTITSGIVGASGGLNITDGASPTIVNGVTTDAGNHSIFSVGATAVTSSLATTINNTTTVNTLQIGPGAATGPVILPPSGAINYDIGSQSQPFRNIYANSFVGSFNGNFSGSVTGSVTGTADSLTTPIIFVLAGDVQSSDSGTSFTGQSSTGTAVLNTKVSTGFITGQPAAVNTTVSDEFLVYQPNTSGSGGSLVNMTKSLFLKIDPVLQSSSYGMPIGAVMPWAGVASIYALPPGWLLCDGAEVSLSAYQRLFKVIGYTYGAKASLIGVNTFALPDMRGRFALGRDNMNNLADVPNFTQAQDNTGANVSTGGQLGAAGRVSDVSAGSVGSFSGNQYVVLATSQLPQHTHVITDPGHHHEDPYAEGGVPFPVVPNTYGYPGSAATDYDQSRYYTGTSTTGITVGNVDSSSIGQAVNVMNPYLTLNYIIFTGNI